MPLPTSGPISLNEIHIEAGGSSGTTASLNDTDIRALAGITSGTISFNDFYGASSELNWATLPTSVAGFKTVTNAGGAAAFAKLVIQPDVTWSTYSTNGNSTITDLDNPLLPDNPEYTTLYYRVISKDASLSGPTVSTWSQVNGNVEWEALAFAAPGSNFEQTTGTVVFQVNVVANSTGAEEYTIVLNATAISEGGVPN